MVDWMRKVSLGIAAATAGMILLLLLLRTGPSVPQDGKDNPETILQLGWGSGPGEAGRHEGDESAPVGPMSFAVLPSGEIFLLDQVNFRILRFDPGSKTPSQVPIGSDAFQDLAVAPDGTIVLLDRLARRAVVLMDAGGSELASHAVEGDGIPEGGAVTAMFLEKDGLWLEVNHERSVRVLDASLHPSPRTVRRGRPLDGGLTTAVAFLDKQGGVGMRTMDCLTGAVTAEKHFSFGQDLYRIAWVEADASGAVHAMFHLLEPQGENAPGPPDEKVLALRLSKDLEETGSFESPHTIRAWEQFKEFQVADSGTVYQMAFSDQGVALLSWRYEP
jgi:hypothetical protein